MGETSISVTARTLERFNDAKADLNDAQTDVPDHNADSFLNALLDTWERDAEDGTAMYGVGDEAPVDRLEDVLDPSLGDLEDLREQLDRIEASAATVEERTNQIQRDVEDLGR